MTDKTAPPSLMDVVDDLIDRDTNGISSLKQLARRMSEIAPRQKEESWRKTLRRWRTNGASDEDIHVVAQAFAIPRDALPEATARTRPSTALKQLEDRLERLEGYVLVLPPPVDPETLAALVRLLPDAAGQLERILKAQQPPAENESH